MEIRINGEYFMKQITGKIEKNILTAVLVLFVFAAGSTLFAQNNRTTYRDASGRYQGSATVNGRTTERREFAYYRLTYSVTVRTKDVDLVNKNILRFHDLAMNNIDISVSNPEFYINDLEQYKLELVNLASASAAERAKVAASQSGSNLGPLMTARQGVIQITEPACNDTSDYGVYNTSSVTKVIRLVMTMTFSLK